MTVVISVTPSGTVRVSRSLTAYDNGGRRKMAREGRCRMCLHPRRRRGVRKLTRHHVVPQAWWVEHGFPYKLRDAEANIIPICEQCHQHVEVSALARGMLRESMMQWEIAFAIQAVGKVWFDARYPVLGDSGRMKLAAARRAA